MECRALMTRRVRASEPSAREPVEIRYLDRLETVVTYRLGENQQVHQVHWAFRASFCVTRAQAHWQPRSAASGGQA
jgi:hypothetical protein